MPPIPKSFAAVLFLALVSPLAAQSHLELSVGAGRFWPSWQGTYEHVYTPGFLYGLEGVGTGRQTLTYEALASSGAAFSAAFFFSPRFALQLLYDYSGSDVGGTTSTHDTSVTYTSRQPPDYTLLQYTVASSDNPPQPGGQWNVRILSLDALFRIPLPARFSLDLSAGASWFHADGDLGYPEYTKFWLGGHAVLFSQSYVLQMFMDPLDRLGWNAGVGFSWAMGLNAAFWVEGRWFGCASGTPVVSFYDTGVTGATIAFDPEVDRVPLGALRVDPSGFRLAGGFRFLF
jgi:hypothetical protein